MGMMKKLLTAGAVAAAMTTGAAQSATVNVSGTPDVTPAPNSFAAELLAAGATSFLAPANITVGPGGVRLTFTAVGAESGFNNNFVSSAGTLSENGNFGFGSNFLTVTTGAISGIFGPGSLAGLLKFTSSGAGPALLGSDPRFGIYASGTGPLSVFFLAFDDQDRGSIDDNHDDYIVRVNVAAVPVPAAGFLLIGALGGLVALRRRKTA